MSGSNKWAVEEKITKHATNKRDHEHEQKKRKKWVEWGLDVVSGWATTVRINGKVRVRLH